MAIVYRHRRNDTDEIFYVGIGKTDKRSQSKRSRNTFWHNIVNKTTYNVEILIRNVNWEIACDIERGLVEYYGRRDLGTGTLVNMTEGGDGIVGYKFSDKSKESRSARMMGTGNHFYKKNHTDDTKEILKTKCGLVGESNGFYDKTHTDEFKQKQSESGKKRYITGTLPKLPIMFGSKNPSSKQIVAINHTTNEVYFIHGGIGKFCKTHELSYHYYKLFCDKGKCEIIDNTHVRPFTKNTVNWEFRTANLAGGDWNRIKKIIQTELKDMYVTVVIYNK